MIKKISNFFFNTIKYFFKELIPASFIKLLQCFFVILILIFILLIKPDNLHGIFLVICWGIIFAIIMYLIIQIGKEI